MISSHLTRFFAKTTHAVKTKARQGRKSDDVLRSVSVNQCPAAQIKSPRKAKQYSLTQRGSIELSKAASEYVHIPSSHTLQAPLSEVRRFTSTHRRLYARSGRRYDRMDIDAGVVAPIAGVLTFTYCPEVEMEDTGCGPRTEKDGDVCMEGYMIPDRPANSFLNAYDNTIAKATPASSISGKNTSSSASSANISSALITSTTTTPDDLSGPFQAAHSGLPFSTFGVANPAPPLPSISGVHAESSRQSSTPTPSADSIEGSSRQAPVTPDNDNPSAAEDLAKAQLLAILEDDDELPEMTEADRLLQEKFNGPSKDDEGDVNYNTTGVGPPDRKGKGKVIP